MSVQTQIDRLKNAKLSIKTAIEDKGVSVSSATKLDEMGALISGIDSIKTLSAVPTVKDTSIIIVDGTYYLWR